MNRTAAAARTAPARASGLRAVLGLVLAAVLSVALLPTVNGGAVALETPPPTVPISPAGAVGQFNLSSSTYAIARRFVLTDPVEVDRWYFAVNGEGADCVDGREGYGAGDGGILYGRIVEVDPGSGLPTDRVLGAERVNGCVAYQRARDEFGLEELHQVQWVQFAPVMLEAGRMYAFVLSNVSPDPGDGGSSSAGNHMSPNLNIADVDQMGPHARNTLDPLAPGAAYGLDPRETTMWSDDSGRSWRFGDEVGWYGQDDGTGGMWPGGFRIAGGLNVAHGWTYMNWPDEGPAEVTYTAEHDQVLVEAGGASSKDGVGVITVRNLDTGASATTANLGAGLVRGSLDQPVPVAAGEQYTVSTDGTVDTGSAEYWDRVFDLRTSRDVQYVSSCEDCETAVDRPMLYAVATSTPGAAPSGGSSTFPVVIGLALLGAVGAAAGLLHRTRARAR